MTLKNLKYILNRYGNDYDDYKVCVYDEHGLQIELDDTGISTNDDEPENPERIFYISPD